MSLHYWYKRYSMYLLHWYKGTKTDAERQVDAKEG
jgi:hypothetical protein